MKNIVLTILEDDPAHIYVIQHTLKTLFKTVKFSIAKDGEEFLLLLPESNADLVVLDVNTPKINGLECTQIIRKNEAYNYLPIIMFSSSDKESVKIQATAYGADKYVIKPVTSMYGEVWRDILSSEYPLRSKSQRPPYLPPLIEGEKAVKKDENWADLDEMMGLL